MCVDTAEALVSIPPLPNIDFSYAVDICDSVVEFTNKTVNAKDLIWEFGDGDTSSATDPVHVYSIAGKVPVTVTATSIYGCEVKETTDIEFVSFKASGFRSMQDSCSGLFTFYDVTENAVTYNWDFGDGTTSEIKNPVHRFKTDDEYPVRLTVNRESSCPDSVSKTVNPEKLLGEILYVPNSFTPNSDGLNDYFSISTYRPCIEYSIEIFNRWGTMIYRNDNALNMMWDGRYDGSMVPQDIYVYILKNGDQQRTGIINVIR
jgi:gliding motility-associated-like protein